ncbi:uncharacterized protein LOC110465074 [Mizuhopecten yessoensis]|uniref:Uncharacterized protein n=1 Tax=Mizuhopecten yessoensis TaxID=6573 RepID=A0A210PSH0_MIZYE|nr:uncharacterized protein LOC110465074 [Mizuhopecten yessoensis]OWF39402.1 hypothetical protein KP79_PYT18574 [Mizuhopecten yessoensis]
MRLQTWVLLYVLLPLVAMVSSIPLYGDMAIYTDKRSENGDYSDNIKNILSMLIATQDLARDRRGFNPDVGLGSRWASIEQLTNQLLAREHLFSGDSPGRR